jgi:hypothetical protein
MSSTPILELADFLDARAARVKALEAEAESIIHDKKDQAGYVAKMKEKAELLAALGDDAEPFVAKLPSAQADAAAERLEVFSGSAATSLRVNSVFFMSALLYPDEHQPGEPNNLERFAAEVRSWA